jgi:hypothetical protein
MSHFSNMAENDAVIVATVNAIHDHFDLRLQNKLAHQYPFICHHSLLQQ